MDGYLLNKNLIFFNPGISGVVFIHPAKLYIAVGQLLEIQECLVEKTTNPVIYIEDRRSKTRQNKYVQNYLYTQNSDEVSFLKQEKLNNIFYI